MAAEAAGRRSWPRYKGPWFYLALAGFLAVLVISGFALSKYNGTLGPFLLFDLSYLLLLLLAVPRPRLYVYTFLSLFLFLGFWMKFMIHTIMGTKFVEPIGSFDGVGSSWDRALLVASSAALGAILVRSIHLIYSRRSTPGPANQFSTANVPEWYLSFTRPVWGLTILLVLALNGLNLLAGFYQIGANPRVILPLHMNVVAAWLLNVGFALWIAALVYWEVSLRRDSLKYALLAPIAEGAVSTISILSRGVYIYHTVPYLFTLAERELGLRAALTRRAMTVLMVLLVVGFGVSLVAVSWLRLYTYPTPVNPAFQPPGVTGPSAPGAPAAPGAPGAPGVPAAPVQTPAGNDISGKVVRGMVRQVLGLAADRWVGMEGVLAVSSQTNLSGNLFYKAIREDPKTGERSMYQVIAKSKYQELPNFTFLTLPGIVAVLYYSGSLFVVAAGMAIIFLMVMGIEMGVARLIGNPFLLSVSGMAIANVIAQLNFPYLGVVFMVELLVTLFFIWLVQIMPAPVRRGLKPKSFDRPE